MRKFLLPALVVLFFTIAPTLSAQEKTPGEYGLSQTDPIMVGGEDLRKGPTYQRAYLDNLTGPEGEKVSYKRTGSCCEFETPNGILGGGLLDMYEVTYEGLEKPAILYFNMYDPDPEKPRAPKGFKLRKE